MKTRYQCVFTISVHGLKGDSTLFFNVFRSQEDSFSRVFLRLTLLVISVLNLNSSLNPKQWKQQHVSSVTINDSSVTQTTCVSVCVCMYGSCRRACFCLCLWLMWNKSHEKTTSCRVFRRHWWPLNLRRPTDVSPKVQPEEQEVTSGFKLDFLQSCNLNDVQEPLVFCFCHCSSQRCHFTE